MKKKHMMSDSERREFRAFQDRVRERQLRTGEKYQLAFCRQQAVEDEARRALESNVDAAPVSVKSEETSMFAAAATTPNQPAVSVTSAKDADDRGIDASEQAEGIDASEQAEPAEAVRRATAPSEHVAGLMETVRRITAPIQRASESMGAVRRAAAPSEHVAGLMETVQRITAPIRRASESMEAVRRAAAPSEHVAGLMETVRRITAPIQRASEPLEALRRVTDPLEALQRAADPLEAQRPRRGRASGASKPRRS